MTRGVPAQLHSRRPERSRVGSLPLSECLSGDRATDTPHMVTNASRVSGTVRRLDSVTDRCTRTILSDVRQNDRRPSPLERSWILSVVERMRHPSPAPSASRDQRGFAMVAASCRQMSLD
jgi:hypothetical protein